MPACRVSFTFAIIPEPPRPRVDALREVTLSIRAGEVVGQLRPSGSGKSTLLNVVGCMVEPNEGWMRLDGEVV